MGRHNTTSQCSLAGFLVTRIIKQNVPFKNLHYKTADICQRTFRTLRTLWTLNTLNILNILNTEQRESSQHWTHRTLQTLNSLNNEHWTVWSLNTVNIEKSKQCTLNTREHFEHLVVVTGVSVSDHVKIRYDVKFRPGSKWTQAVH
jgi:hypothetical protein